MAEPKPPEASHGGSGDDSEPLSPRALELYRIANLPSRRQGYMWVKMHLEDEWLRQFGLVIKEEELHFFNGPPGHARFALRGGLNLSGATVDATITDDTPPEPTPALEAEPPTDTPTDEADPASLSTSDASAVPPPALQHSTAPPSQFRLCITGAEGVATDCRVDTAEELCDWVDWLRPIVATCNYDADLFNMHSSRTNPVPEPSSTPRSRASSTASNADVGTLSGGAYGMSAAGGGRVAARRGSNGSTFGRPDSMVSSPLQPPPNQLVLLVRQGKLSHRNMPSFPLRDIFLTVYVGKAVQLESSGVEPDLGGLVWNHTFGLMVEDEDTIVTVAPSARKHIVRVHLNAMDLGVLQLRVGDLEPHTESTRWYKLTDHDGGTTAVVQYLQVTARWGYRSANFNGHVPEYRPQEPLVETFGGRAIRQLADGSFEETALEPPPNEPEGPPNQVAVLLMDAKGLFSEKEAKRRRRQSLQLVVTVGEESFKTDWAPMQPPPVRWNHGIAVAYRKAKYRPASLHVELHSKRLLSHKLVAVGDIPLGDVADYKDVLLDVPLSPASPDVALLPTASISVLALTAFIPSPATAFIKDFDAFLLAGHVSLANDVPDSGASFPPPPESGDELAEFVATDEEVKGFQESTPDAAEVEEAERKEAESQAKVKEAEETVVKPGDYQVHVHVIMAKDLKGEDANGLSDPVVEVTAFSSTQTTKIHYDTNTCVFDETFVFMEYGLREPEVEQGTIKFDVFDSNRVTRNTLIGTFQLDVSRVYFNKDHEFYRQWLALVDPTDEDDQGIQGYLRVSVAVIGPGDKLKIHNGKAEAAADGLATAATDDGGSATALQLLLPQTVKQDLHFLCFTVHKCVDLPRMDYGALGIGQGIDAYVKVAFAGGQLKSNAVTVRGSQLLHAEFNEQFFLPVLEPTFTKNVAVAVYNKNAVKDDLVATTYFNYDDLRQAQVDQMKDAGIKVPKIVGNLGVKAGSAHAKRGRLRRLLFGKGKKETDSARKERKRREKLHLGVGPFWVPLYGAPTNKRALTQLVGEDWNAARREMNEHPELASWYRGSMLVSMSIDYNQSFSRPGIAHKRSPPPKPVKDAVLMRRMRRYSLVATIVAGSDIPRFKSRVHLGKLSKMSVRVSIGPVGMTTARKGNNDGEVVWGELLRHDRLMLPEDVDAIPDVFIYLVDRDNRTLSYYRRPAAEVIATMWQAKAEWVELKADGAVGALKRNQYPGAVLVRMGMGTTDSVPADLSWLRTLAVQLPARRMFQLRVHVFQARNLLAADADGTSDPYVVVRYGGNVMATRIRPKTTSPVYNQTLTMPVNLMPLEIAPKVVVQVWDKDRFSDDLIGTLRIPVRHAFHLPPERAASLRDFPLPRWYELSAPGELDQDQMEPEEVATGSSTPAILMSLQLVLAEENAPRAIALPDISPPTREAWLEVVVLGLRNLAPYQWIPIKNPKLELSVSTFCTCSSGQCPNCKPQETARSRIPSGDNPNFLSGAPFMFRVQLPLNGTFAPYLRLSVRDSRLGGLLEPVVAVGSVPLLTKIPWLSATYRPPCTQPVFDGNPFAARRPRVEEVPLVEAGGGDEGDEGDVPPPPPAPNRGIVESKVDPEEGDAKPPGFVQPFFGASASAFQPESNGRTVGAKSPSAATGLSTTWGGHELQMLAEGWEEPEEVEVVEEVEGGDGVGNAGGGVVVDDGGDAGAEEAKAREGDGEDHDSADEGSTAGNGVDEDDDVDSEQDSLPDSQPPSPAPSEHEVAVDVAPAQEGAGTGLADAQPSGVEETKADTESDGDSTDSEIVAARAAAAEAAKLIRPDPDNPEYLQDRQVLDGPLEQELKFSRFETYRLYRGQQIGDPSGSLTRQRYTEVGLMKGTIRVVMSPTAEPLFDMKKLFQPTRVIVRVYLLGARGLTPQDPNGKADPYPVVKLGSSKKGGSEDAIMETLSPDWFVCHELETTIPGESVLELQVWDYDRFSRDDLIGTTRVDLEDRYFDDAWHGFGMEHQTPLRLRPVPLEMRPLWSTKSNAAQGQLMTWVDILTPAQAKKYPAVDVKPPPPVDVEVRMVVWRTREVINGDEWTDQSDLYAKAWIEGQDPQQTDTHFRCKNGAGSFNYRMKFPLSLPAANPLLYIQLWDKDLLSVNDCLAETTLNLSDACKRVYRTGEPFNLFLASAKAKAAKTKKKRGFGWKKKKKAGAEGGAGTPAGGARRRGSAVENTQLVERQRMKLRIRKTKAKQQRSDASDLLSTLKESIGIGDEPEDASWLSINALNRETQKQEKRGDVLISIEILPKALADNNPAGFGRSEPNINPYLPPPTGRIKLNALLNPFSLVQECIGPKMCGHLKQLLCVVVIVGALIFGAPLFNAIIPIFSFAQALPEPANWIMLMFLVSLCLCCCCGTYCFLKHKKAKLQAGEEESESESDEDDFEDLEAGHGGGASKVKAR